MSAQVLLVLVLFACPDTVSLLPFGRGGNRRKSAGHSGAPQGQDGREQAAGRGPGDQSQHGKILPRQGRSAPERARDGGGAASAAALSREAGSGGAVFGGAVLGGGVLSRGTASRAPSRDARVGGAPSAGAPFQKGPFRAAPCHGAASLRGGETQAGRRKL